MVAKLLMEPQAVPGTGVYIENAKRSDGEDAYGAHGVDIER